MKNILIITLTVTALIALVACTTPQLPPPVVVNFDAAAFADRLFNKALMLIVIIAALAFAWRRMK